ncbi:hypothetical protein JG687_00015380 [Phytophthora cactorum]|nr:hypothetical protein PC120_g22278 [Phytophthora cactorum]KAG3045548.1 hypothetical protein PC121_g21200 [Phytophthora cactorum]KAG4041743.1 hypothetical protein PC123_g22745 [Phytophthora cactorum]KAG6948601.1 hypothetical protein JG687_00015380 [Phytophthora cactorum]
MVLTRAQQADDFAAMESDAENDDGASDDEDDLSDGHVETASGDVVDGEGDAESKCNGVTH